ncbi:MAG: transcriptional repressor [Acidobacteria bacterium]|nr:transcriptional repressor [Acidobacteriota bacterium]
MREAAEPKSDAFRVQKEIFYEYLDKQGLKRTQQREVILETFLHADHHINVDQLIERVRQIDPTIGQSTVYRTVNIFLECGIAQELRLTDETRRLEPIIGNRHHDHLICTECGSTIEFFNCSLEVAQIIAASKHGFKPARHSLKIYGTCRNCQLRADTQR